MTHQKQEIGSFGRLRSQTTPIERRSDDYPRLSEVTSRIVCRLPIGTRDQQGFLDAADLLRLPAAGVEPAGGLAGLGTSPVSTICSRESRVVGSGIGTADSRA